jgi:hypothetical protein
VRVDVDDRLRLCGLRPLLRELTLPLLLLHNLLRCGYYYLLIFEHFLLLKVHSKLDVGWHAAAPGIETGMHRALRRNPLPARQLPHGGS